MTYFVGKNGDHSVPLQEFETLEEAEKAIVEFQKIDPEGVYRGDYYIDGSEEL